MESSPRYDVVVLGSGPGGYVAAIRAAQLGHRTAIVERERLGGICLNWGCIPTKALLESARLLEEMKEAEIFGLTCTNPQPQWEKVIRRSRAAAEQMSRGVEFLMKKNGIEVIKGTGRLLSPHLIEVTPDSSTDPSHRRLEASHIILATGGRPRPLRGLEFDGKEIISYREAMVLPSQPRSLLIIGAGAIGVEFAYFFSVMGTEVTVVELMDQILPLEDHEVAQVVQKSFSKRGIKVYTSSQVSGIKEGSKGEKVYQITTPSGVKEVAPELCLVAVGIQGNTDGNGAESLGIETERSFFKVDNFMRTNIPNIYAIGDCAGPPLLAHVASHEGICAVETLSGLNHPGIDHHNFPACTYCHPEVGSVGMTEKQAREKGYEVSVGKYLFRANGRAVAGGHTEGFVKFVVDKKYGEVLGVHIVGPSASELIAEVVLGREFELTAREFHRTIHAHPTLSEAVMEAAGDALKMAIHL